MTTRTIYYDAVAGYFKMSEEQDRDWHRTHDDYITGVVLRDESPAPSGDDALRESMQIQSRKAYMKRDRRNELLYSIFFYSLVLIAAAVFCVCILGAVR